MDTRFPEGFLWGASTSAYQVEGAAFEDGKKASQQDVINKDSYTTYGFATAEVASDQYHHFKEDVALMKEMGFTCYRFSIAWSRVMPDGTGAVNPKGVQYYHDLIDELKKNGIEPIVTMYHYDCPWALVEKYGGWLNRQIVADFTEYARFIINEYRDDVKIWTTINEQSIIVQYWTQKCWIPEELLDGNHERLRYQINHYMNLCHAIACNLVHELVPGGIAGSAIGYSSIYPLTSKAEDVMAMQNAQALRNDYYTDIYFKGMYNKAAFTYLAEHGLAPVIEEGDMELIASHTSDFLALNYYASECAKWCPDDGTHAIRWSGVNRSGKKGDIDGFETHPGFYQMCRNPNLDTTDWDWAIDPTGLEYLLRDLYNRYNKPLMITENGLGAYDTLTEDGCVHDSYRIDYLREHIRAMKRAMDKGVEMIAYCPWSAVDLLSTSNGVKKRYGLIYIDRTDDDPKECARIRKDSFFWYQKVLASNGEQLDSQEGLQVFPARKTNTMRAGEHREMIKKPFKDIELSRLGLGNMRFILTDPDNGNAPIDRPKAHAVIDSAYENGINYFDTAYVYNSGDSERCLGEAMRKYPRDSFYIADKFNYRANPDYEEVFEEQLKRLQTDHIDFYLLHCIMDGNADSYMNCGCIDYFLKQKELGRITYLGFSSHAGTDTLRRFASLRSWDFAQIQLNYYDWYYNTAKEEYEILTELGIPVMVMEPVRGGRLAALTPKAEAVLKNAHPDWSIASWAMRFAKSLVNTQVILSGMNSLEQMNDNLNTFGDDSVLSETDQAVLKEAADLFRSEIVVPCTACRYCTEGCPMQINIPEYLRVYNDWKASGGSPDEDLYNAVVSEGTPDMCIACGACTGVCPQSIAIPDILKEFADAMK